MAKPGIVKKALGLPLSLQILLALSSTPDYYHPPLWLGPQPIARAR
jgi:hypothetical protein